MSEIFQLYECGDVFQFTDPADSYQTWQGLQGPPGPQGPPGENGTGLYISGTVATVGDLPASADQSTMYNVGAEAPYELYMYDTEDGWISLGYLEGPQGPAGAAAGFGTPTASVDGNTGTPGVTVMASGPDTAKVFAFAFTNLKGAKGDTGAAGQNGTNGTDGAAAGFGTPTISVGSGTGTPTASVTASGPDTAKIFAFSFDNLKGAQGAEGPEGPPGKGLTISGTVASTSQLPVSAEQGTVYNVGLREPYELYMYETGTGWISLGYLEGPAGTAAGFGTPTATVDGNTGTPGVTITASGPDTAKVFDFAFTNLKGATGAAGQDGNDGAAATIAVGTVSGLPAGSTPTVTNSGSSSAAVFNFGIPAGAAGQDGTDGTDGVSPEVTITSITGGHTVKITDADHPTGQSFNVMDGSDGAAGAAAGFGTPTASVDGNVGTPGVTITASGPNTAKVFAFAFTNLKGATGAAGQNGTNGTSAGFGTPTASVDGNVGTPGVTITASGPDTAKVFDFAFTNLKGATGATGQGVPAGGSAGQVLTKTSGTDYATAWATPEAGGGAIYKQNVAILATSGTIATVSDANITADFVVASIVFANPSAITSDVTWTTGAGSLTLTGTCTSATTADIILVKT